MLPSDKDFRYGPFFAKAFRNVLRSAKAYRHKPFIAKASSGMQRIAKTSSAVLRVAKATRGRSLAPPATGCSSSPRWSLVFAPCHILS